MYKYHQIKKTTTMNGDGEVTGCSQVNETKVRKLKWVKESQKRRPWVEAAGLAFALHVCL